MEGVFEEDGFVEGGFEEGSFEDGGFEENGFEVVFDDGGFALGLVARALKHEMLVGDSSLVAVFGTGAFEGRVMVIGRGLLFFLILFRG